MARNRREREAPEVSTFSETLIKPLIREGDGLHVLESIYKGDPDKMPVLMSVGYGRVPNTNTWVSYTMTSRGKEVLSIDVSEPNLRTIAEDEAKVEFVTQLMNQEL